MSEHDLQPQLNQEVRQWAMFCHFAAFLGLVFPFGNLIGPLIVWQIKKDLHPFIDDQGKEALNFQISVALAAVLCFVLMVVVIVGYFVMMLRLSEKEYREVIAEKFDGK